jgi:hypothetical protein
MSFINKKDQLDEKHTLLFNHTEFLKAWKLTEEIF